MRKKSPMASGIPVYAGKLIDAKMRPRNTVGLIMVMTFVQRCRRQSPPEFE
jgi:hypothetical protein